MHNSSKINSESRTIADEKRFECGLRMGLCLNRMILSAENHDGLEDVDFGGQRISNHNLREPPSLQAIAVG